MAQEIKNEPPASLPRNWLIFLFEQPYCKIRFLVSRNMAKARTASKYSYQLHERGFLDVPSIGCKKKVINPQLWDILTR